MAFRGAKIEKIFHATKYFDENIVFIEKMAQVIEMS